MTAPGSRRFDTSSRVVWQFTHDISSTRSLRRRRRGPASRTAKTLSTPSNRSPRAQNTPRSGEPPR